MYPGTAVGVVTTTGGTTGITGVCPSLERPLEKKRFNIFQDLKK